jgi:uncharacterized membrane protein
MVDQPIRSFIKTISWRITGSLSTFLIAFLISGDFSIAGSIAVIQIVANTVLYYIHERVWNCISFGRQR